MIHTADDARGYTHPLYAESLAEFGRPHLLPQSQGWILERTIPETGYTDAMGCYPLFVCRSWNDLPADLSALERELVSLAVVIDPFAGIQPEKLPDCFPDVRFEFKPHCLADLSQDPATYVTKHHRYYARRALTEVSVEHTDTPMEFIDDWCRLYHCLVLRHGLTGLRAFSRRAFSYQLRVPGAVLFRALFKGEAVAAHLWYVMGDVAYSHLAASNDIGYGLQASYALYSAAMAHFNGRVRWLELGGSSGVGQAATDGLWRFKQGWSSTTRSSYFCGRIHNTDHYRCLTANLAGGASGYFPAYRQRVLD